MPIFTTCSWVTLLLMISITINLEKRLLRAFFSADIPDSKYIRNNTQIIPETLSRQL